MDKARNYAGPTRQVWIDAQLPPALAVWLRMEHGVDAVHVEELGLHRARDPVIFATAKDADRVVVVLTKDDDFRKLLGQHGPPPQVIWILRQREESGTSPYRECGVATNGGAPCGWRGSRRDPPTPRWGQLLRRWRASR